MGVLEAAVTGLVLDDGGDDGGVDGGLDDGLCDGLGGGPKCSRRRSLTASSGARREAGFFVHICKRSNARFSIWTLLMSSQ